MGRSPLRFLLDECIPSALFRFLQECGHDVVKAVPTTPDIDLAAQAKSESRILVTFDNDFSNRLLFSPKEITILLIRIHPPDKDELKNAVGKFLETVPVPSGFILLERTGPTTILD